MTIKTKNVSRTIYLTDEITSRTAANFATHLQNIIDTNDTVEDPAAPIKLVINCPGGDTYDGLFIMGAIKLSPIPVHTYSYGGRVMSMALPVFLCGQKRFATNWTTFMIHSAAWEMEPSKIGIHKNELEEANRIEDMLNSFIVDTTLITSEKLSEYENNNKEWYIPALEAKKLKIVHKII